MKRKFEPSTHSSDAPSSMNIADASCRSNGGTAVSDELLVNSSHAVSAG